MQVVGFSATSLPMHLGVVAPGLEKVASSTRSAPPCPSMRSLPLTFTVSVVQVLVELAARMPGPPPTG